MNVWLLEACAGALWVPAGGGQGACSAEGRHGLSWKGDVGAGEVSGKMAVEGRSFTETKDVGNGTHVLIAHYSRDSRQALGLQSFTGPVRTPGQC